MRRFTWTSPTLTALVVASSSLTACSSESFSERTERALLERQAEALSRELSRGVDTGAHPVTAVVVVGAAFLQRMLDAAMPVEAVVDRFRVTAREASVDFRGGLALVRLAARVTSAEASDVAAEIDVVGALQVLGIREDSDALLTRVEVLGLETRDVRVGGLAPPAERLLDGLARSPTADLNQLLDELEIPVRLTRSVRLPRVAEDEIDIASVELPLEVEVYDVRVGGGRLWVFLEGGLAEDGGR